MNIHQEVQPSVRPLGTVYPAQLTQEDLDAIIDFIAVSKSNGAKDKDIITINENDSCGIFLRDGSDIPCLALYVDELDNYVVLTRKERKVKQFLFHEIS